MQHARLHSRPAVEVQLHAVLPCGAVRCAHRVGLYQITPYRIMPHHIVSYHTTSYHIISCRMSHHNIYRSNGRPDIALHDRMSLHDMMYTQTVTVILHRNVSHHIGL